MLFVPHLNWLWNNNFQPFTYAEDRLRMPYGTTIIHSSVLVPTLFIGSQLLALLPALLAFIVLTGQRARTVVHDMTKFDKTFLSTITFGPCFLVLIAAILFGLNIHDMWAMPFWNFIGLWALAFFRPALSEAALRRFAYSFIVLAVAGLVAYAGGAVFYPYFTGKPQRIHFPGELLANTVSATWHQRYNQPLKFTIGDTWPAGNVAFYSSDRPHVFIRGDYAISPWIKPEKLKASGGVLLWCVQYCSYGNHSYDSLPDYVNAFPTAEVQKPLSLPRQTIADVPPVIIGWAIVPPQK